MKSWLYIAIQAVLLVLIITISSGNSISSAVNGISLVAKALGVAGLVLTAVGLFTNRALTVLPNPKSKAALQTKGLYKHIRHPMYTSVLLLMFGVAVGSPLRLLFWTFLVLLFFFKARYEEKLLIIKFDGYKQYKMRAGMFLPRFRKAQL